MEIFPFWGEILRPKSAQFLHFSEIFREPDIQLGYFFNFLSIGTILSSIMILVGVIIFYLLRKKNEI